MNIGETSKASGLPAKTIRYYEDIGLIAPARTQNGYRDFSQPDVHRLQFLARARKLGFSVQVCRQLMALYQDQHRASEDVRNLAKAHLSEIEAKMTELRTMHDTLSDLVEKCAGDHRPDCPILKDLADGSAPKNES